MDVGRIGQGGQANFDLLSRNNDSSKVGQNAAADKIKVEAVKAVTVKDGSEGNLKEEDIKKAVDKLNKLMEDESTHAVYEVHEKLKDVMIKIVDNKTNEVILEIPPRKILDMVSKMMEMVGMLIDKKA